MKRPRRRERPAHSWDRLRGTRLEVLPLPGGEARRLCVDVDDPLAAVVSFGTNAMVSPATGPCMRLVAVDNWNTDARELWQIPEARAWFQQLWNEGKPLLRLLSESTADMPADDRFGLNEREVSQLGFGWWDVFVVGMCTVEYAEPRDTPHGQVWGLAAAPLDGVATRESVRAELLQMSTAQPEGYTFDDAANRRVFMRNNMDNAAAAARKCGQPDAAVFVLSLLDVVGLQIANGLGAGDRIRATMEDCRRADLHPGMVVAVPRTAMAEALSSFSPDNAARVAAGPPKPGWQWAAFVAFNGTALAAFDLATAEAAI
jgi:hypothetical protein